MLVEILILILTIILAMVETSTWPQTFFYLTIISVILLNMANGVYQNTVYGLAARLPDKYTGAVVLGSVKQNFLEQISVRMNIRIYSNIRIFSSEYWYSYSIRGNFECQILFEYSNILSKYWSLKIRRNAGIKEVLLYFFNKKQKLQ